MSKFDYMNFNIDGWDTGFVAHAKKYSKEDVIDFFINVENDWRMGGFKRKPTVDDIEEKTVRWYPTVPEGCGYDGEGGCYSYCNKGERGSFPVWVIEFEKIKD